MSNSIGSGYDYSYRDEVSGKTQKTDSDGKVFNAVFTDEKENDISAEDFLQLMVAQLKNQDFMNPVDDTQYVTQLAQFSTMQQMQELAAYSKSNYVMSLIGKEVTVAKFTVGGDLDKETGPIQRVSLVDNEYTVYVNDKAYTLDQIMEIHSGAAKPVTPPNEDYAQGNYVMSLLGKEITVRDKEGDKVTGIVERYGLQDNQYVVYIDGEPYTLDKIVSVGNKQETEPSDDKEDEGGSGGSGTTTPPVDGGATPPSDGGSTVPGEDGGTPPVDGGDGGGTATTPDGGDGTTPDEGPATTPEGDGGTTTPSEGADASTPTEGTGESNPSDGGGQAGSDSQGAEV